MRCALVAKFTVELEENKDSAAAVDLTAKGAAFVFQALAVVRGVGCDIVLDDDGDDNDDGDKSPDFGAGLGVVLTAGVRRPRTEALAAIVLLFNGV